MLHYENLQLIPKNPDRQLIYSGPLLEIKQKKGLMQDLKSNSRQNSLLSQVKHPCYGLLFDDYFITTKMTDTHTPNLFEVDQVFSLNQNLSKNDSDDEDQQSINKNSKSSSVSVLKIINSEDQTLLNSFSIKYNHTTATFICENALSKTKWLQMFANVLDPQGYYDFLRHINRKRSSFSSWFLPPNSLMPQSFGLEFSEENIAESEAELTQLLTERHFDEAKNFIVRARKYLEFVTNSSPLSTTLIDDCRKIIQSKEQEMCRLIEKEIQNNCARRYAIHLPKFYYHHVQILKQLGYVAKAW